MVSSCIICHPRCVMVRVLNEVCCSNYINFCMHDSEHYCIGKKLGLKTCIIVSDYFWQ